MGLSLGSNSQSLRIQGRLQRTTDKLSTTFERLASGQRINDSSDDPAGLILADKLRADSRIASSAIRNANDGISVTSIADSALNEIGTILQRLGELATQSSNGTYSTSQRSALSSEFVALGSEIERISKTTTFNGVNLLSGSSSVTFQVGIDGTSNSQISLASVRGTLDSLGLAQTGSGQLTFSLIDTTTTGSQAAAQVALNAINGAIGSLSIARGTLGAANSRLSTAVNYLSVARENFTAAESRIRDSDVADDVAQLTRLQVLQQAQTAVLAQANQQPSTVLALLR